MLFSFVEVEVFPLYFCKKWGGLMHLVVVTLAQEMIYKYQKERKITMRGLVVEIDILCSSFLSPGKSKSFSLLNE